VSQGQHEEKRIDRRVSDRGRVLLKAQIWLAISCLGEPLDLCFLNCQKRGLEWMASEDTPCSDILCPSEWEGIQGSSWCQPAKVSPWSSW
jgi:hypothetical protein